MKVKPMHPARVGADSPLISALELEDGLRALGLGVGTTGTLPANLIAALQQYGALLQKWNRVYNLTSKADAGDILHLHLLDSLALLAFVRRVLPVGAEKAADGTAAGEDNRAKQVLDVGSGGGLPGLVLAMACPDLSFTLIDAVDKKCTFLRQAVIELGLTNVRVVHGRVENLSGAFNVIVSRAFASLADFIRLTRQVLAQDGWWLAMKGVYPQDEINELPSDVVSAVDTMKVPGLTAARHVVRVRLAG